MQLRIMLVAAVDYMSSSVNVKKIDQNLPWMLRLSFSGSAYKTAIKWFPSSATFCYIKLIWSIACTCRLSVRNTALNGYAQWAGDIIIRLLFWDKFHISPLSILWYKKKFSSFFIYCCTVSSFFMLNWAMRVYQVDTHACILMYMYCILTSSK